MPLLRVFWIALLLFPASLLGQAVDCRAQCKNADDAFVADFDLLAVGVAVVFMVILPLVLPPLLRFRWWWLSAPYARWFYIAPAAAVVAFVALVLLPWLAATGRVSASAGMLAYPGDAESYVQCARGEAAAGTETAAQDCRDFEGNGLLRGYVSTGRGPAVVRLWKMLYALVVPLAAGAALYWLLFLFLLRPMRGLRFAR